MAVWDGDAAAGLGGTADVVDYAHACGREAVVIWPPGRGYECEPPRAPDCAGGRSASARGGRIPSKIVLNNSGPKTGTMISDQPSAVR